jgi:glycosyltransferase involved in cell wall biosynthesis
MVAELRGAGVEILHVRFSDLPDEWRMPDLLHDHGVWLGSNHACAVYARRCGIPCVISPRGMLEPWSMNHKRIKKKVAWWLYQRKDLRSAALLHATAVPEAKNLEALCLGVPVVAIPNGVTPGSTLHTEVRLDVGKGPRTVLFLGRIHPKKGLPLWVEAWAKVRPQGWRMRIIGPDEGGHAAEVRRLVQEAGLSNDWSVETPLEGDEKWEALANADVFVLPTFSENFGIVVAEALVAGTPVITTTGTPWDGLHAHRCGWWVPPSVNGLAGAFKDAIALPAGARREMGLRGREWMQRDFSWEGIGRAMLDTYRKLLEKDGRRE